MTEEIPPDTPELTDRLRSLNIMATATGWMQKIIPSAPSVFTWFCIWSELNIQMKRIINLGTSNREVLWHTDKLDGQHCHAGARFFSASIEEKIGWNHFEEIYPKGMNRAMALLVTDMLLEDDYISQVECDSLKAMINVWDTASEFIVQARLKEHLTKHAADWRLNFSEAIEEGESGAP